MIVKDKIIKNQQDQITQFIPRQFSWITKEKKIRYNNINLKTDYLINIMHELILRYLTTNETIHRIWSIILRQKYGEHYNHYIKWLVDNDFMFLVSDYYVTKKTRTYRLNITYFDITKCKVNDKILLKKFNKEFLKRSFTNNNNSPINNELKEKLVNDLYHVNIDYDKSIKLIENKWFNGEITKEKHHLNTISIENIKNKYIFFKFDDFGRFHTNFTILKKDIRDNFLTINNEEITNIDIKNSQPLFFSIFLKNEIGIDCLNKECLNFIELANNGLIYNYLCDKYDELSTRNDAKLLVYKVLFGSNNDNDKENKIFKDAFPTILNYIIEFKEIKYNSYRELSHQLQKLESNFIFEKVVKQIYERIPDINIFTVHDSIYYPKKHKDMVELIFNYELNLLKI